MKAAPFVRLALWTLVAAFVLWPDLFAPLLRPLAPDGMPVIYDRAGLADLTLWHLGLVVAAMAARMPNTMKKNPPAFAA